MIRKKILHRLCVAIVALSVINLMASFLHWYDLVWWFDMPMHFLGGMAVFYLSALLWLPARKWVSNGRFLYEGVITALLFGVLWEALELYLHITYGSPYFVLMDAISDVCFDLAGALLAGFGLAKVLMDDKSTSQTPQTMVR